MNQKILVLNIQLTNRPGAVKAHVDIRIELTDGSLFIYGFSVIEKDGKPLWIGFPGKQGKIPGKYFPVVTADGGIEKCIVQVILEAYHNAAKVDAA